MTSECMIEMAHLHMKHSGSFSFTSFSKKTFTQFIIPHPSSHYHRSDWHETVVASTRGWHAVCTGVVSLETTTQEYHDYKSHCTWQPQRWQTTPNKVPVCGELFLQALKEMYFPLLGSFSKDSIPPPPLTGGQMPEAVLSANWVQAELKVRWLKIPSLEESYFEVFFFLN